MAIDDKRNYLEYCPIHSSQTLLAIKDIEFKTYFSIGDEMMFCCPLLGCDYVRTGGHDRIFSQLEFVQMIIFARQKAFLFKVSRTIFTQ